MKYSVKSRQLVTPFVELLLVLVFVHMGSNTALAEEERGPDDSQSSVLSVENMKSDQTKRSITPKQAESFGLFSLKQPGLSTPVNTPWTNPGTVVTTPRSTSTAEVLAGMQTRLDVLETNARTGKKGGWDIDIGGYGEFSFSHHDYGPDQTKKGGALPDNRVVFDTKRFTVGIEGTMDYGLEFEVEVEIEHGGTGAALELEFEEFGEFDSDIERGGEVVLEEMYIEKKVGNWAVLAGRFNVALGLLPKNHSPSQFLGSSRPESETTVIPAVWDEVGVEAHYSHPWFRATAQLVNGLDSTGFSSQRWVASGHQQRFELIRATDVALVGRLDVRTFDGVEFGVSTYLSPNSTNNRPKPDLKSLKAPIAIVSAHLLADIAPFRVRSSLVWGHLSKSAAISDRNSRLSNNLDVLRTSVASQALSYWSELGVDVFHYTECVSCLHRLEPFVRVEYYDTMFRVAESVFDNPRFAKTILSLGIGYTFHESVIVKLDYSHRRLSSDDLRNENTAALALGFEF